MFSFWDWLQGRIRSRWLWALVAAGAVLYTVWDIIPDKYQTKLVDYVLLGQFDSAKADAAIQPFIIRPENDEALSWLKFKIERNLAEHLANNGLSVAHELGAKELRTSAPRSFSGSLQKNLDGTIELTMQFLDEGSVRASTSFAAPYDFLKTHYRALPETVLYGLDLDTASLKPLKSKSPPTTSLKAFAVYLSAKAAAKRGDPPGARKLLQEALGIDPFFAMAAWALGETFQAEGNIAEARLWQENAAAVNKDHPRWPFLEKVSRPLPDLMVKLQQSGTESLTGGIQMRDVTLKGYGLRVVSWSFPIAGYRLQIGMQSDVKGSTAKTLRSQSGALLAVNGGFFEIDNEARLSPSGLLVTGGRQISAYRREGGSGLAYIGGKGPAIGRADSYSWFGALQEAVQSGPVIVEPGGKNGIYKDDFNRLNRSAICLNETSITVVVVTGGLSLYEMGELLSAPSANGGFGCDSALNLDGGPSTQVSFLAGKRKVEIEGLWKINNALLIMPKKP